MNFRNWFLHNGWHDGWHLAKPMWNMLGASVNDVCVNGVLHIQVHSSANGWISCWTCQVLIFAFCTHIQTLMSASLTMEVATTTAITQMEVTLVPVIMVTNLTAIDVIVKVGWRWFNEMYVLKIVQFWVMKYWKVDYR